MIKYKKTYHQEDLVAITESLIQSSDIADYVAARMIRSTVLELRAGVAIYTKRLEGMLALWLTQTKKTPSAIQSLTPHQVLDLLMDFEEQAIRKSIAKKVQIIEKKEKQVVRSDQSTRVYL